jgi:uncharacterized protein YceK
MKRLLILMVGIIVLSGCASTLKSEFQGRKSHYASWSHMKFSLWGYKNPSEETMKKSSEEGWWGIPVTEALEK